MNTTAIYIKTDPEVKKEAQHVARQLGFSLSSLMNAWLREFVRTKNVHVDLSDTAPSDWQQGSTFHLLKNASAKSRLKQSEERKKEFMDVFGTWSKEEADAFNESIKDMEVIDKEDWV